MSSRAQRSIPDSARAPRRVVALGGGTGLPVVLRGLRGRIAVQEPDCLTAVVAMTDEGGSSGRLRKSQGLPPPGDVRNCIVALAEEGSLLAELFQHRYTGGELGGHSVGNLLLAALAEQTGSFLRAVEELSGVLRTTGRILPVTEDNVRLVATLEDGSRLVGETNIGVCGKSISRIALRPRSARPTPGVVEAILGADLVVLGPGSLFTSVVPHLTVAGVAEALRRTVAPVVLVANLVSERGEAADLDLLDHLDVIARHAGGAIVDAVLVNDGPVAQDVLERYREEGASPLRWAVAGYDGPRVVRRNLLAKGRKLRHDPAATADGLLAVWTEMAGLAGVRSRV